MKTAPPSPYTGGKLVAPIRCDRTAALRVGRLAWTTLLLLTATACTTTGKDGTVSRHYFGYAVVSLPVSAPEAPRITATEVRSYGLAIGGGTTVLGVSQEHHVALPPDGRMYLVVQTDAQFEQACKLIEKHPELGLCVTKNTQP